MLKLKAKELRTTIPSEKQLKKIKKNPIYIILDNVLDTYNVGAIFRLADAVAAKRILLCGETEIPPHTRIKKASINTTCLLPLIFTKHLRTDCPLRLGLLWEWRGFWDFLQIKKISFTFEAHSSPCGF